MDSDIMTVMMMDPTEVVIAGVGMVGAGGLMGFAWWLGEPSRAYGRRISRLRNGGCWCVVADHGIYGYEPIYKARTQRPCVKWRNRNRKAYGETLFLLREGFVDEHNLALTRSPEYWKFMRKQHFMSVATGDQTIAIDTAAVAQDSAPIVSSSLRALSAQQQSDDMRTLVSTDAIMVVLDGMEAQAAQLHRAVKDIRDRHSDSAGLSLLRGDGDNV